MLITPMTERMATGGALQPDGSIRTEDRLAVQEVGDLVVHLANMPLNANIPFVLSWPGNAFWRG